VAQFSGYVSEHSGYHHGEASLNQAIKGLAQNFVGSNNINLLFPSGQFGTRLRGGDDAASERYIFTRLEKITRFIFPEEDDAILTYLDDDGLQVEPIFYAPIIPMVLVNGSKGIGTGFSTEILCYNPLQIMDYIQSKLAPLSAEVSQVFDFVPHYDGFKGQITRLSEVKFLIRGCYEKQKEDKIRVTELPVGFWTNDFKELLEELIDPPLGKDGKKGVALVKDYQDMSSDTSVDFYVTFAKGKLEELEASVEDHGCNAVEKLLKLYTTVTTTNMRLFDASDKLRKYDSSSQIIDDYFVTRLHMYAKRREYLIRSLKKLLVHLGNKVRYIQETLEGEIDLRRKNKSEVTALLGKRKFDMLEDAEDYDYLTRLPMHSVTTEHVERIFKECEDKKEELAFLERTSPEEMWLTELAKLRAEYADFVKARQPEEVATKVGGAVGTARKVVKKSNKVVVSKKA
jgi:DNA topoisomerase-2